MSILKEKIINSSETKESEWHKYESHARSIAKAVSYRCFGSLATGVIGGLLTGSTKLAFGIGISDFIIKIILFYAHERAWHKIKWGISRNNNIDIGGGI